MTDRPVRTDRGEIADARWHPEVELKFRLAPETVDRLLAVPPLAFATGLDAPARTLESVYFDTATRKLQKAGVALRVRRDGERHVQTLKMPDPDRRAHARLERHDVVDGLAARADVLRATGGKRFAATTDNDLEPVFATRIERRALEVAQPGVRIEVALDRGTIEAGDKVEDVCEIELELIEGTAVDLYRLALELHRLEPLAIEVRTKSERGYTLAGGSPPHWRKAGALALDRGATLHDAIAAVFAQCFDHWTANQAAALDGRDIEGVHQMRVALRRLRAAMGFFGPWLPPAQAEWFEREVKWLARKLGAVRDLDVLLAEILAPVRKARGRDRDLKLLVDTVRGRQAEAHGSLAEAIVSPRYTSLLLTFGAWVAEAGWRTAAGKALGRPLAGSARPALDASLAAVLQAGEGFDTLDPAQRHTLRLAIKRLRYAVQFVGAVYGEDKVLVRRLGDLQDALGAANDAALAEALLEAAMRGAGDKARRRMARATGLVVGWWLARGQADETALRALWQELLATPPSWRAAPALKVVSPRA